MDKINYIASIGLGIIVGAILIFAIIIFKKYIKDKNKKDSENNNKGEEQDYSGVNAAVPVLCE